MTMKVGIRDLVRNSNILDGYDYLEVEDKKTHEYKGIFVSPKYAEEFKAFLEDKLSKEMEEKLDRLMKYAGKGEIHERFDNLTSSQIKEKMAQEKYEY
jgi:guanylate kinase